MDAQFDAHQSEVSELETTIGKQREEVQSLKKDVEAKEVGLFPCSCP